MTPPAATAPPPRPLPTLARHLARALILLGGLALLLLIVFGALLAYVRTPAGTARLLHIGLDAANGAITGRVTAGSATIQGNHVVLREVSLTDAEGGRVAFIEEVQADVVWSALLRGRIEATSLRLIGPALTVVLDDDGSNLDRAFSPRHPAPPDEGGRPPPLTFVVRRLDIERGSVNVQTPDGPPLSLQDLALAGSGRYALRSQDFQVEARGNGALDRPTPGPVTIVLQGEHSGNDLRADVDVRAAGASVVADLRKRAGTSLDGHLALDVPAALARALVPGWPLRVPLALTAEARREGTGVQVSGDAAAGRARLQLRADVDVERALARRLRVEGHHLHLAELFGRGPESDLAFTLTGSVGGRSWASASGKLELEVPATRVRGADVGPVEVALRVQGGRLDVSSLHALLPGVELRGSGHGSTRSIEASLALEVKDLAALTRTLGDLVGPLPPLGGQGLFQVKLAGRPSRPSAEAEGHFTRLEVGPVAADGLALQAKLPDLGRPLDSSANFRADQLVIAGRRLREVSGTLSSEGRAVELQFSAAGPLRVHLAGTADPDARGLLVDTLGLEFPEQTWSLKAPAAVRFDGTHLETERLELVSAAQSIAFTGRSAGQRVEAELLVRRLDLGRLPAAIVPASAGLAGILDLSAQAHGPERHPDLGLSADLAGGAWHGLTGLDAHVDARRNGDQLHLAGHASGLGATVDANLDGPEMALQRRIHLPLTLRLRGEDVDLSRTLCELAKAGVFPAGCPGGKPALSGRSQLEAEVDGFADGPRVHLVLRGTDLRARDLPPAAWTLTVDGDDRTPVALTLRGNALDGTVEAQATLESTTGQLLARRRTWAGWRTVPLRGAVHASGLTLAPLQQAGFLAHDVQGTADVEADVSGTLAAPRGRADVQLRKLVVAPWPATDLHLALKAEETVDAQLTLTGAAGTETGSVHLTVGGPLSLLWTSTRAEDLAQVPVKLEGQLGPLALRDLPMSGDLPKRDRRLLEGELRLTFESHGTLLSPGGMALLTVTGLGPAGGAHFEGTARLSSAEGKHALEVTLRSAGGGTLDLVGDLQLDVSLPALRRGLALADAPVKMRLHSVRFAPDFVASLLPWVRSIGGTVEIDGQVAGRLGHPELKGSLAWTDGSMGVIGFGLYQAIQLKASASNDHFAIEQLSARVQGGTVKLQLEGKRAAAGFSITGALSTEDFPVVLDDQLWCIATLEADLSGSARPWILDLSKVTVTRAELQLPESKRKNLQDLSSPPDVILTRRGVPIDRRGAVRALAADPRRRGKAGQGVERRREDVLLRLVLEDPNHISVRSRDINLELALSKDFEVDLGEQAIIQGDVRILRGRGEVWGRRFEVQPGGRVHFDGPANRPQISVTGVYTNVQNQVKVYMQFVSSEDGSVQVIPSSDPPMSETEIYTLLATGRTTLKQSSLGSSSAVTGGEAGVSIIGSWAAGELKKAVGSALPIDVISIEVNEDRGVQQTKVEAGKYLTDDIYIGYQARTGADPFRYQNANTLRVEYQFLRRWSLQLEYGDANAGSLDGVWSRDY